MEIVNFLAQFWGISLALVGFAFLLNPNHIQKCLGFIENEAVIVLSGIVGTMLGVLLVLTYSAWGWNWQGLVTFLGWAVLIEGLLWLFFPAFVLEMLVKYKQKTEWMPYIFLGIIIVGCFLVYSGFSA
ncbi:MAG: hypothetical protein EXS48_00360 [Candidatus Staskawiczbacteria bacterium]|nr:hypothetical protein [Candidatus Staskawiczbacteria bacterium]